MDLFELAGSEPEKEPTGDLFDIARQESISGGGGDLFDFAGEAAPPVLPAEKPTPWSETTPGYVEEIAARAPGVGFFPFAAYAPQAGETMPKLGKEYPGPFGEKPPELEETRFLKRPPEPRRIMGPEGISFEVPRKIQPRITDEPYFFRDVVMGTLQKFGETAVGAGESAASFAGGMLEFLNPIPGLVGIGKILTGASPEEQTQAIQELQEKFHPYLVYEPETEEGKKGKQILDWAFQNIQKAGQILGETAQRITTPVLGETMGAAMGATIGGSTELIIPAFVFGRLAKARAGKTKEQINIEENLKAVKREVEELTEKRNLAEIEPKISGAEISLGFGPTKTFEKAKEILTKEPLEKIPPKSTVEVGKIGEIFTKETPMPEGGIIKDLKNTTVLNEQGDPLVVYHGAISKRVYTPGKIDPVYEAKVRVIDNEYTKETAEIFKIKNYHMNPELYDVVHRAVQKRENALEALGKDPFKGEWKNVGVGYKGSDLDPRFSEDIGLHFGTKKQAEKFAGDYGEIFPVYLNIKNLVEVPDIFARYDQYVKAVNTLEGIGALKKGTHKELTLKAERLEDIASRLEDYRDIGVTPEFTRFWKKLRSSINESVDGFKYRNEIEDAGQYSYVALRKDQIIPLPKPSPPPSGGGGSTTLGFGPTGELQSLYERIFKDKKINIGKVQQSETGVVRIPLLAEGEEIGGIKLRQEGQEYIVSAIGRYNRAKETGKGMPTEALKAIIDQATEEGMQVRAKNAERAGEYYAGLGFKKEGPDYVFGPNEYKQKLFDASVLGVQKMIAQEKTPILGLGPTGQLQKVYESLRGLKKRTEPLPKYARSINLERQAIKEEFKNFEADIADLLPEKKVQTWDQTGKLADEILGDYQRIGQTLHKAEKGFALNAAEIEAARRINVTAVNRLAEMAETKGIKETNELIKIYSEKIFKTVSDASSEAGRALNIHKKFVAPARLAISLKSLKNGMNERQFKEFQEIAPLLSKDFEALAEMDMGKVQKFIDRLPDPKLKDYFFEYWYNSILSGIPTHLVNFSGNTLWQAWNIPIHHPLVSAVDAMISKFTGRERQVFFNEIFPMLAGIKSGAKKGWGGVKEVVRTGQATEFQTKWDKEIGGGAVSAFERSPNAGIRAIAPYITAPSRALRAMDVWANSIAYDAKMRGLIRREGLKRGLEGEKLEKFERELQPTEAMMKEASEYAQYITFMDDPGPISTAILNLREKMPLGRLIVPFVTTIGNLLKRGLEMTPGIGAFMGKGRMPAEVIAKQIEGSIISFWVMKKCLDGDITGPVPQNPNEREAFYRQEKLPWAIKIGDGWFQFRRLEPFNTVIASVAIAYDKIVRAKSQDDAANIFYDVARGIWENLLDSSYFSGATQMLQRHGNIANMGLRQLSSMVPFSGFWRSINRALETVFEDNAKVREVRTVLGAFSQVIPGLWKEVPAKIDVWGEEIELPGNALRQWLPWKYSEAGGDLLEEELERLKIYPSHPGKQILIGDKKIELPEEFYRDYAIHFGSLAKQRLTRIINSPGYQRMPDEAKEKALDRELRLLRYGEAMRAKREYVKEYGMPTEEMNLNKRTGGY